MSSAAGQQQLLDDRSIVSNTQAASVAGLPVLHFQQQQQDLQQIQQLQQQQQAVSDSFIFDIMDIPDLPSPSSTSASTAGISVKAAVKQANQKDVSASTVAPSAPRLPMQRRPSIGAQGQTSRCAAAAAMITIAVTLRPSAVGPEARPAPFYAAAGQSVSYIDLKDMGPPPEPSARCESSILRVST